MDMIGLFFLSILMAIIVGMIASSKNRSGTAWGAYGLVLWPIALVHILLKDDASYGSNSRSVKRNLSRSKNASSQTSSNVTGSGEPPTSEDSQNSGDGKEKTDVQTVESKDWMDELERLNDLRESGALSDDEFEQQKKNILPDS